MVVAVNSRNLKLELEWRMVHSGDLSSLNDLKMTQRGFVVMIRTSN
jgi:hypothetical protein